MPHPKPEGDAGAAFMALPSLPVPIPWYPDATAVYDVIRCSDLTSAGYDDFMSAYITEAARVDALLEALPADAPREARRALEQEGAANERAGWLALLRYTRCQVHGLNPTPDPDKPETWAHLHSRLLGWLATQGRYAAMGQFASPLAMLRPPR